MDFTNNPALLSAIQSKLQELVGRDSGYIKSLPPDVKRRINALKNLQNQQAELESKLQEEILALERKYHALYEPLYDKRLSFVSGEAEPTDEEATLEEDNDDDEAAEEAPKEDEGSSQDKTKGIPQFWLTAMRTHPVLMDLITERDEDALKHLTDIRARDLEDNPGFKLEFFFQPNEYFSDSVLTKTYYLSNDGYDRGIVYDHAEGTKIQWKEGKDLSVIVETKKQRHKGTNKTRIVKKTTPTDTFFNFFTPPVVPDEDEEEDADMDELQEKLEADYEIGELFKLKIIPHAVDWCVKRRHHSRGC
ncbi:hypothetical protein DFJ74DRAFT_670007 [Hyaloraphidium curvatum]|nr:hypothetical protein DFJ74DRAFT_670007 [Hyaloraphidium curvatum]